ncbi:PAS domain S-box protein [Roseobacter sp. HKCCA0434]|uniref:PAS domain S-box protein n=1 Tax=Roseobacter sp. HKCCA0434 TaxID=3079297 RepID=UPI002905B20D|nr:PAS domain S-box protein [Roseobacter sp. HKCCA0434]
MENDERLREALIELETLRQREAERLSETQALLSAVEALAARPDVEEGLAALLASIRTSLDCGGVALFEADGTTLFLRLPVEHATRTGWDAPGLLTRARRIVDLHGVRGLWQMPPEALSEWRALMSVPLEAGEATFVLAAHDQATGAFGARDAELLSRLAPIVGQAILRRDLERRNAFLASVIDRSPTSVAIARAEGDLPLVYVNDAFTTLTGYTADEVLGRNCRVMSDEPADAPVRRQIRQVLADRGSGTFILRNRRKDGSAFWNRLELLSIEDTEGRATHIVATQSDATARIQAEMERDHAQRRLEDALAATSEGFLILGRDGDVRFANATFAQLIAPDRVTRDAPLPRPLAMRLLDAQPGVAPDRRLAGFDRPISHEIVGGDGRQLLLRARPIPDGGAVITLTDVTQLKVNERLLRQRLAAIERSQDGIAIGDMDGRIIDANPSLLSLWGLADEAGALGRRWHGFYEPEAAEAFRSQEAAFRLQGLYRGEARIALPGGHRTHEISLSLVPDLGSILVVRDVTDRLRDMAERDEMRRALDQAQAQERLHRISAGLAHDFNNLLSAILGSAELLDTSEGLDVGARAATGRIRSAAGRAAELVEGLLDFGAREKTAESVDLGRVLANTVDLARAGAPTSARLTLDLGDRPVTVEASRTDLLQVVMNLLVNAIDALGGEPGEVRISLDHPAPVEGLDVAIGSVEAGRDYARIEVADTGPGMPPETVARMLEPYFTTKGNSGTGLGLAIVSTILGDAGGLLAIDSAPGRGTRMQVFWPMGNARPERSAHPVGRRSDRVDLPLLVLDDLPEVAASHAAMLASAGYEVAELGDPVMALEAIAEDPDGWGCLVSDYDMPGLSGGDLIERLAIVAPDVPVIVVSALARRLTDRRLDRASQVLQKPVTPDRLQAAVRSALGRGEGETR